MTGSRQTNDSYLVALRLLTGQDYTTQALRRKLLLRKFSVADANATVERLTREGYLQDRRYAERFVAAAQENGRFVGYRLRQELQRRGVPVELISAVMQESPDDNQLEHARELIARRYTGFDPRSADDRERRRIAGFLQRRGYRGDLIRCLLERGCQSE